MAKKGKTPLKKWRFRVKKWGNGLEKMRAGNQTRKAIWCKMQATFSKIDKAKDVKG